MTTLKKNFLKTAIGVYMYVHVHTKFVLTNVSIP